MPRFSYHAAAWGHLASYAVMLIISTLLGNKYYRIPYSWGVIALLIAGGLGVYALSAVLPPMGLWLKLGVHTLMIFIYVAVAFGALYIFDKKHRYASQDCQ